MKTKHNNRPLTLVLAALALSLSGIQPAQAAAWTTNSPMITARYGHTVTLLPNGKLLAAGGCSTNFIPSLNYLSTAELYDPANGTWTVTGSQAAPRAFHTATLLPSGKVLIVGGNGSSGGLLSSAELYDPASGTWTTTGALATAREYHTATLLPNGKVLVVGGETNNQIILGNNSLASAELYDPATGRWTATGALKYGRYQHTATLLQNGKVLAFGGSGYYPTTAELYDPASGTWTTTGSLSTARTEHTATMLPDGRVLAAGGGSTLGLPPPGPSAELYDPVTGTWTGTGGLSTNRFGHTATLLPNGKVLAIGGYNGGALSSAELFDPATGTWTSAGTLAKARQLHTATVLPNGKVLVAGGQGSLVFSDAVSKVELYDSASGAWTATGALTTARTAHTAILLPNGSVLFAAGYGSGGGTLSTAELYNPATGTFSATGSLNASRANHTATLLPNGKVLVASGLSAELYSPATGNWTTTGSLNTSRSSHTATLLRNGKVLVVGGSTATPGYFLASAELYDPAAGTWKTTGSLSTGRYAHTATLLTNGKVLVVGGWRNGGGGVALATTELYDPATGTWSASGTLSSARVNHKASLLPSGKVLVAGGIYTSGFLLTITELYDPTTGTWSLSGPINLGRAVPTATLLPGGKVLLAGGEGSSGWVAVTELYDPAAGKWTTIGSLSYPRWSHTATLLVDGKVLLAGGNTNGFYPTIGELFGVDLGFMPDWQPQIATVNSPLSLGDNLALTGSGFRGVSEGSCGNSQDSAADYPLVQLRSLESGQTTFLLSTDWQTNSFTSAPVWGFPPGYALATVFVNGIPSTGSVINISVPVPTTATLTDAKRLTNGVCQFCFTNSVGALFGVLATTNPALPLSNWTALGRVTEVSPGQFQFTDPQATNTARRFYRLRSL
jgi:uncharacterized delta-60 repeat protein